MTKKIIMNKRIEVICKYFGHQWVVNDYSNSIKATGEVYKFSKKRICTRCYILEYFYDEWVAEANVSEEDRDEGFSEFNKMENRTEI